MHVVWDLELGDEDNRTDIQQRHGGSSGRGISAPAASGDPVDIMLWWRPERGEQFGYEDGWSEDRDAFYFAGTGQVGDQQFEAPHAENGRVRDHAQRGDRIRLLRYTGRNTVRYVGELGLDPKRPYAWIDGHDAHHEPRRLIQFRFVPVGRVLIDAADPVHRPLSDSPQTTAPEPVPPEPAETSIEALGKKQFRVAIEARDALVQRRELLLVHRFAEWLYGVRGIRATGLDIPYAPERRMLRADLFLPDKRILVEAKATTAREHVRTAIGQLLDYRRWLDPEPRMCVLTPHHPQQDMLDLLSSLGIAAVWEAGTAFESTDHKLLTR